MQPNQFNCGVIVRTSGRAGIFLRRALDSIVSQTLKPALIVVINDGDEADVVRVEGELATIDLRGISLRHLPRDLRVQAKPNRSAALNRGIAAIDTRWVSFLDDDDTWTPRFLERIAPVLAGEEGRPKFGGVVTQTCAVYERVTAEGIQERRRKLFNPELTSIDLAELAAGNRFTINSMVVRREVFGVVGPYREDLPVLEDWEFNVRAAAQFHFEVIPEALVCYHIRPVNDSSGNSSIQEHRRVAVRIRNEWLQADLAAGRLGLGQLALAGESRGLGGMMDYVRGLRRRIRSWFGKSSS